MSVKKEKYPHNCNKCNKDVNILYGKGPYNNNKDNNFYCEKCYKKVFKEEPTKKE